MINSRPIIFSSLTYSEHATLLESGSDYLKKINENLNIKERKKSCESFWRAALIGYG